jgi:hypothetical protein
VSNGPIPESPENGSGTQLPIAAGHLIANRRERQPSSNRRIAGEGFDMKRKIAYSTLAVVVAVVVAAGMLIGSAGPVLAENEGTGVYGTTEYSFATEPEMGMQLSDAGEIREPIETGALPEESAVSHDGWVNLDVAEQNSSPELRGLPNIQEGGGGD